MSEYNSDYYQKNAGKIKAAARARYRQKYGGLKRGDKVRIEIPEKYVGPLREWLIKQNIDVFGTQEKRVPAEAAAWLLEELKHV